MSWLLFALALILFSLLIIAHEYGHFLVARRNGVKVKEFGLGFPPKLFGKTLGKGIWRCYYSFNLLPIGGFVRLEGENDTASEPGTYGSQTLWVKTKIIMAGVAVNFLIAVALFTVLALTGIPKLLPAPGYFEDEQFSLASDTYLVDNRTLISYVHPDSPAERAGLQPGDQVLSLDYLEDKREIESSDVLIERTRTLAGKPVTVSVKRESEVRMFNVTLRTAAEAEAAQTGRLGISTSDLILQRNTWSAPLTGAALAVQYTKVNLQGLGRAFFSLFKGDVQTAQDSVVGPVGIFVTLKATADNGLTLLLMMIALLSLTLAIVNALPIPALDGGRLMLTLLFRKVLKRPLTKKLETRIVGWSMAALLVLVVLITIVDIQRFIL